MVDCVLCILPKIYADAPTVGPAVLKTILEQNNLEAMLIDYNLDLYQQLGNAAKHIWFEDDTVFKNEDDFEEFFELTLKSIMTEWCDELKRLKPRWVGLSIFSQRSRLIAKKICQHLRDVAPEIKIVIGGANVIFSGVNFYKNGLCDAFVIGDAEDVIVDVIKENPNSKINNPTPNQISNLDTLPIPDYSDLFLSEYVPQNDKELRRKFYITGSRGCVRNCTFCDVSFQWPKYRYRSGKSIADEMLVLEQKFGAQRFQFTDSLVNGSMKAFREMCETLANSNNQFQWEGQFICRSETQMPPIDFDNMTASGCERVFIGVESGSEKIRNDMNKGFSDEDLWYTLEQLNRVSLSASILLIVGYPTETEKDFQLTKDMIRKFYKLGYIQNKTVEHISLGTTMQVYEGTDIYLNLEKYDISYDENSNWYSGDNTEEVRLRRHAELQELLEDLHVHYRGETKYRLKQDIECI